MIIMYYEYMTTQCIVRKSLAAGHQTTANFGGSVISAGTIHVHDLRRVKVQGTGSL
jgi:hypothetical protein